jgi:hypothetical protein
MKYLKFETQEAFTAFNQAINTIKGYDDGKGAETYTLCHEGSDDLFYAPIREKDLIMLENIEQTWLSVENTWPKPESNDEIMS